MFLTCSRQKWIASTWPEGLINSEESFRQDHRHLDHRHLYVDVMRMRSLYSWELVQCSHLPWNAVWAWSRGVKSFCNSYQWHYSQNCNMLSQINAFFLLISINISCLINPTMLTTLFRFRCLYRFTATYMLQISEKELAYLDTSSIHDAEVMYWCSG